MKGVVISTNKEKGQAELENIKSKYEYMKIPIVREVRNLSEPWVIFENEDIWELYTPMAIDKIRGKKANIAIIDKEIDKDTVNQIIFPMLVSYPYCAYNYF